MRTLPSSLAPVVTELELTRPAVVTKAMIAEIAASTGSGLATDEIIHRLQRRGWLLSLRVRGAWEFAPADRAGPISGGDPFIEVRALQAVRPHIRIGVAMESAAFLRGLASRQPNQEVIAVDDSAGGSLDALREFRRVTIELPGDAYTTLSGLQVQTPAAILVTIATRPNSFRDWPGLSEWLQAAAAAAAAGDTLLKYLAGRPAAAWARTAYLLHRGGNDAAAELVMASQPGGTGPYYLGPRRGGNRDAKTQVIDSVIDRYADAGQGAS